MNVTRICSKGGRRALAGMCCAWGCVLLLSGCATFRELTAQPETSKSQAAFLDPQKEKSSRPVVKASADVDFGPYMANMQKRIKRHWFPPKMGESRQITVGFKVKESGDVSDLKITKSSGSRIADEAAIDAVSRASPLAALPEGAPPVVDIEFTFDYNIFGGKTRTL